MVKNKKGWIRIVEAFMAIIFLLGFLMIIIANHNASERNSLGVEKSITDALAGMETNATARNLILAAPLPYYSNDSGFPAYLTDYLQANSFSGYTCAIGICSVNTSCILYGSVSSDVYSSEILVFSNSTYYSPREVRMSCY